jgi:endoglucanase
MSAKLFWTGVSSITTKCSESEDINMTWFHGKGKHGIWVALLITVMLTGCTWHGSGVNAITDKGEQDQMKSDPALGLSIETPKMQPDILVDQNGYRTGAEKMVIFRGDGLPKQFEIRRVKDNAVVYTGSIKDRRYNQNFDEYDSYGYFTDFQTDGQYYIQADVVGSSYAFTISDDVYQNIFSTACKQFYLNRCGIALTEEYAGTHSHSVCHSSPAHLQENPSKEIDVIGGWHLNEKSDRDVVTGCEVINNLLLAYEMNPDSFTDASKIPESGNGIPDILDEVKYETDWLQKMQNPSSGGVYAAAVTSKTGNDNPSQAEVTVEPEDDAATIAFAASMARFSYIYQNYDKEYATKCLQAADLAWQYYTSVEKASEHPQAFAAAAELYRTTGDRKYEKILTDFFREQTFIEQFKTDDSMFMGGITYLLTSQPVNVKTCSSIMKALLDKTENIVDDANRDTYYISETDGVKTEQMLSDMRCLTVTNHVIYSHEYTAMIENYAHYLMGRNPGAANLVDDTTEYTWRDSKETAGIISQPVADAQLIILISAIDS